MNERITLFAKLAEEYTYGDDGMTYDQTIQNETSYEEIFDQKFAELIIQECVDTIMNDTDRHRKEYFAGLLKEHFGVE
jgi:rubrerythrin